MRYTTLFLCLLAVPGSAQTLPKPGLIGEALFPEPVVIEVNSADPALTVRQQGNVGISTFGSLTGIVATSYSTGGRFSSSGTALIADGLFGGLQASCQKVGCTSLQATSARSGIGIVASGGIAIKGIATETSFGDSLAGSFVGDVRVEGDLAVQGQLVAPEIDRLTDQIAALTERLNAIDGGGGGAFYRRVQAEDYDPGGQGVGYFDTTPGNDGGAYRNDDVDIKVSQFGGYAVGWMPVGEWLAYTVHVPTAGTYALRAMVGTIQIPVGHTATRTVRLEIDGQLVSDTARVPIFSEWDQYSVVSVASVDLAPGPHVFRFGVSGWDYMDFQWFDLTRQ